MASDDKFWSEINHKVQEHNKAQEELARKKERELQKYNDPSTFFDRSDPELQRIICREARKSAIEVATRKNKPAKSAQVSFLVPFDDLGPRIWNHTDLSNHFTPMLKKCLPPDATIKTQYEYSSFGSVACLAVQFENKLPSLP